MDLKGLMVLRAILAFQVFQDLLESLDNQDSAVHQVQMETLDNKVQVAHLALQVTVGSLDQAVIQALPGILVHKVHKVDLDPQDPRDQLVLLDN